jgi:phosphate starvation-inducible protein PhoH
VGVGQSLPSRGKAIQTITLATGVQVAKRGRNQTMNTKTPNTRKKFRRLKRQLLQAKALEAVTPNKQVGKWSDIRKMFAENKAHKQQ